MSESLRNLSPERRAVLEAIWAADEPIGAKELAEIVPSSEGSIRQMLGPLLAEGLISRPMRGKYQRTHQSGSSAPLTPRPSVESNAELIHLGATAVWIPIYPATLGAGFVGDMNLDDIEPDGGFPLPPSLARSLGINGDRKPFAVGVRGDSMTPDFQDGSFAFGYRLETPEPEAIHALYFSGELLIKRVRKLKGGRYELLSSNPAYTPIPVDREDVHVIGRIKGALNSV